MNERLEAAAASGLPERKSSRVPRVVVVLVPAVLALLAVACSETASEESRNIHDFECDPSKIENLIDDGEGYDANRIGLKLSSDILPDNLVDIFEEEQICVLPGLLLRPNSFGVQVKRSERDEVIDRFEEEMGEGVEEVRKVPITKFE